MRRSLLAATLFALLAVAAVVGWWSWWTEHRALAAMAFTKERLAFLEAETKRLQAVLIEKQQASDAAENAARRGELEATVERMRALRFLQPVAYRQIPRTSLPAILRQKLAQQVPDQEFHRTSVALAALGVIPHGMDLQKTYLGLLGEQVGAFYDQHSAELFTFSGQPLTRVQNRVILAHELTHALEDQHFHLARLPLEAKGNDDRALAASALVEGDATLVMNRYMTDNVTADAVRETLASALTTDVRQLAAAPRYLRDTLLFPYLRGQEFCQVLFARGGWPALAEAFAHPPSSTSQILHPERFLSQPREEPIPVDLPVNDALLGQTVIADNVLGELGLRELARGWLQDDKQAAALASGWRGDRYAVYGDADASSYVLETVWRSPAEADAFATAANLALSMGRSSGQKRAAQVGCLLVARDGSRQRVLIVSAQNSQWFEAMKARFGVGFGGPND